MVLPDANSSFVAKARISPLFDRTYPPLPKQPTRYNDDIRLAEYLPAEIHFAGRHRMEIREPLDYCSSFDEHIREALKWAPLANSTPLPGELFQAAFFSRDIPRERLMRFWEVQLNSLEQLISSCELAQKKWGARIHPEIRPDSGKFRTVSISQMMNQHGLGGS